MKSLTSILYFVAILGLIEASWRHIQSNGLSRKDKSDFLRLARTAMLKTGDNNDKMAFLKRKLEDKWGVAGRHWNCIYGYFWDAIHYYKAIKIFNGNNVIVCFSS